MPIPRTLALLGLAFLGACASTPAPLSATAAAMPVFSADHPHPAVGETMGMVRAYACLSPTAASSIESQAQNDLRRRAEAKGANALVGYSSRILAASPHAQTCSRILEVAAEAVTLGGGATQASTGHARPG